MKALSLTQPMAWALFHGKDVENRPWNTHYRGPLLIHASRGFDAEHLSWIKEHADLLTDELPDYFLHGFILGVVDLSNVMKKVASDEFLPGHGPSMGDRQRELEYLKKECPAYFSQWYFGPYGFVIKNAQEFRHPIPYRGALNLFNVPDNIVAGEMVSV